METEYARFGDYDEITDGYHTLGYINGTVGESAFLKFEKSAVTYANGNKTCSCGGAAANKMLITYRDMKAPCAPELSYSTDGGKNYKKANEKGYIGMGTTIILRLTFDEPIRFADDDKNHGDLYLELRQRGATAGAKNPRAMLKALSGNSLYFEYTVKKTDGTFRVAGVYSDSLFGLGLELKQVVNDKSFTLEKSGEGFAETTSYITDIAGNAITKSTLSLNVDIDNEPPKVDEVIFDAELNDTEVTEALGFDDDNNSHRYLGEGDSVSVMIRLDEVTDAVKKTSIYSGLTAVTNILVTDGVVNSNLGNIAISGLSTKKINGKNYLALTSSHAWNTEADGEKDSVTAFLMLTIPPEFVGGEENHCAVIALTTTDSLDGVNIFVYSTTIGNHWYHMTFEENNGIYSFDTVESDGGTSPNAAYSSTNGYIQGWWRDIVNGKYSGELEITVLSGKKAAFVRYPDGTGTPSVDRYAPVSAGNSE